VAIHFPLVFPSEAVSPVRVRLLAAAIYVVLLATVPSGLFRTFELGVDEEAWWVAVGVLLIAASIAVGAAVARAWVLLVPTGACVALVAFSRGDGLLETAQLVLMLGLPVLLLATVIGWGLGRVRRLALPVAAAGFAVALVPAALAAVSTIERAVAPVLSPTEQARLPARWSLVELCGGAERRDDVRRLLRRQAVQLVRDVRARPDHLVDVTNYSAETEFAERARLYVRERAEEELEGLSEDEDEGGRPYCAPSIQRDLRSALDAQ